MRISKKINKLKNDERYRNLIKDRLIKNIMDNYGCLDGLYDFDMYIGAGESVFEFLDGEEIFNEDGKLKFMDAYKPMKQECCKECFLRACCSEHCEEASKIAEEVFVNNLREYAEKLAGFIINEEEGFISMRDILRKNIQRKYDITKNEKFLKKYRTAAYRIANKNNIDINKIIEEEKSVYIRSWNKSSYLFWKTIKENAQAAGHKIHKFVDGVFIDITKKQNEEETKNV